MTVDVWDVMILSLLSILATVVCVTYAISAAYDYCQRPFGRQRLRSLFRKTSSETWKDVEKQGHSESSIARYVDASDSIAASVTTPATAFTRPTSILSHKQSSIYTLRDSLQLEKPTSEYIEDNASRGRHTIAVAMNRVLTLPVKNDKAFMEVSPKPPRLPKVYLAIEKDAAKEVGLCPIERLRRNGF